ncbi:MAG: hypothetical protein JWP58_783 [Hymenobacter sp.]|nr:hypothetical protein [Hymenobacter sp.]
MQHFSLLKPPGAAWRRGWLALLWLVCTSTAAMAQTITIGSTAVPVVSPATSSYLYGPIYRSGNDAGSTFNFSRYAHLYTPAELNIPAGAVITQLAWLKTDAGAVTGNNTFNVLLENSALTTLGTSQTWATLSATTTSVYASTTQQVTGVAGDYFSVTLSQPFVYTGGNLLVLTDWQKQGTASAAVNFVTNLATGLGLGAANSVALTGTTALTAASYGDRRPTLRVTYTPGSACTAPPTAGTTVASAATVCAGLSVSLTLQGAAYGSGQTYQWQESTNGTTFTDIAGATNSSYTVSSVVATRTYRARLTCSGQSATSTPATVTVNAATYATLPVLESFESTWLDACASHDAPTNNWRTTPNTGNNSWRREDDGTSAAWSLPASYLYTPVASQGTHSARFHSGYTLAGVMGMLDLYVNLSPAGAKRLSFDVNNSAGTDSLVVQISADGGQTFSKLAGFGVTGTGFVSQVLPITSTSATTVIRFRGRGDYASNDIGLDNIVLESATGCLTPANLTVTGTTATTASVSWLTGGAGTYSVLYGPTGFNPALPTSATNVYTTVTGIAAPPYTITGLTASTAYQFYVVQNCSATTNSGTAGPVAFTTACVTPLYAALPVTESFEGTWISRCGTNDVPTNNWRNTPVTGNNSWRRDDDGVSAAWTSPTLGVYTPAGSQGTRSARFHSYYAGAAAIGTLDLFVNLSATGNKVLQFDYLNTAGNDSLQVQVSTDGGVTFGAPLLRLGVSGTAAQGWQAQSISLTSTSATTVVRFRTKVTTTFTSDIGLDNVRLDVLAGVPSCVTNLVPANGATGVVRSPTLTWTSGSGVATGYDVYFGTTATPPLVSANQSAQSYTPTVALAANTLYYYQVVPRNANGAATGCSVNSFTTTSTFVYCNSGLGDYCGTADVVNVTVAGTGLNNSGVTCNSSNGSAYTSFPATGTATGTLQRGISYQLSVTTAAAGIISVWVDFNQNGTFEASEWTQVATASVAGQPATATILVPATAVLGQTGLRIRSRSTGNTNGSGDACTLFGSGETEDYIVTIGAAPACAPPTALGAANVSTTTASLTFTAGNGTATNYIVQYGPTGFNPALPSSTTNVYTTVNTTNLSVPVTGLTATSTYQFYVTKDCGGGQTSQVAGPFSFTTLCVAPVYATLPLTESFENTWASGCGTQDIPTTNWRNTPVTGNNSWRRDDDGTSAAWTSPTAYIYTPLASQGTHSARFHSGWVTAGIMGTLDLYVNLSPAGAKRLSFDVNNSAGTDSLVVEISANGGQTFSKLAGFGVTGAGFVSQVLPITSTSATAVIRFRGRGDYASNDIGLDNIVLESATGCLTPAALTATTTTTTAALTWLTGGTGTYTVVYGPTGFNPATGGTTVSGLTAPPLNITGLTPGTTYQFYVTLNCSGSTNSGTAGPGSFTTQIVNDDPCGATTLTVTNTCTALATTTLGATQTASTVYATTGQGTGCGSITAPRDVWFKFTTAATGPTSTAVRITVTGGPASVVRGYSGAACTGPLTYLSCSGTASNTAAPVLDLINLLPSTTYYVRVNEYSTSGTLGNFTICATPVPNCPVPAGLAVGTLTNTTAVLTWSTPVTTGNTYTVIYGPTGFNPATGGTSLPGLTAQTVTLTGLTASTGYDFYVQQVCGGFNGSSALSPVFSFTTPLTAPTNDEPCGAVALSATAATTGSNVGSTTSVQNGINTPACSPAANPQDVWFTFTAGATSTAFTFTGSAAGMVRVFTTANCTSGPFNQVFCLSSGASNTGLTTVPVTGLTAGTLYYVAVSGWGSSDAAGSFTLRATNLLANKAQMGSQALLVYPNPSNTGSLTLKLSGLSGAGQATLLNALGQVVLTKSLSGTAEQVLDTHALATGLYTLRVSVAGQVLTRKVVLE